MVSMATETGAMIAASMRAGSRELRSGAGRADSLVEAEVVDRTDGPVVIGALGRVTDEVTIGDDAQEAALEGMAASVVDTT